MMKNLLTIAENNHQENTLLGFWVYIMSDCILFAMLFAVFIVLRNNTVDGPRISDVATLPYIFTETIVLLTSSFTCGLAMVARLQQHKKLLLFWLSITILFGVCFVGMEYKEFLQLINHGNSWQKSAALSAFFTLVGTHGLHVTFGILWMVVMIIQIGQQGITPATSKRLQCMSLFWHFLDIVWIFVFSVVYLL